MVGLESLKTCVFERVGEVLVGLEYLKTCVVRWGVVESIGALKPKAMSVVFTALIEEWLGIPGNRIYLSFEDVDAGAWGWNGRTFGG